MALRDLSGTVDFVVLERTTGGDQAIAEEVLELFTEQAALWTPLLDVRQEGWRDAAHTIRGTAASIGAGALAAACEAAETADTAAAPPLLDRARDALDVVLADVAAYRHALVIRSLRG